MGRSSCLGARVSTIPVHVAGEWYPPVGVITLAFDVFRHTSVGGVDIQRTPGDKVTVEKRP